MVHSCAAYSCKQRYEKGITFHQFPTEKILLQQWLQAMRRKDWQPSRASKICSRHFSQDCYEINGWTSRRKLKPNAVPTIFSFPGLPEEEKSKQPLHGSFSISNSVESVKTENNNNNEDNDENIKPKTEEKEHHIGDCEIDCCIKENQNSNEENGKPLTGKNSHCNSEDFEIANYNEDFGITSCEEEDDQDNSDDNIEPVVTKRREHYIGDFDIYYGDKDIQKSAILKYMQISKNTILQKNKQIKLLQQTNRRLKKKLEKLEGLLKHLIEEG